MVAESCIPTLWRLTQDLYSKNDRRNSDFSNNVGHEVKLQRILINLFLIFVYFPVDVAKYSVHQKKELEESGT